MRIISAPKASEHKSTCSSCSTVVMIEPSDCGFVSDDRDGNAVTWKCPTCGHVNWVATTVVGRAFEIEVQRGKQAPTGCKSPMRSSRR